MPELLRERTTIPPFATNERSRAFGSERWRTGAQRRAGLLRFAPPGRGALSGAAQVLDGVGGLGWSVIGFVVGATFWHFIGFWTFMADVVLAGGGSSAGSFGRNLPLQQPSAIVRSDTVPSTAAACVMLSRERGSGLTTARPCDGAPPAHTQDGFQGREDRLAAAGPVQRR